jgi:hypothetical protein
MNLGGALGAIGTNGKGFLPLQESGEAVLKE